MVFSKISVLLEPISESAPCGLDLDLEGDLEFMNFLARADGFLPAAFFTRDADGKVRTFDRSTIVFDSETKTVAELLTRTRDLRLLTLQAKLSILNRQLPDLAVALVAISRLLADRWDVVHPCGENGDYTLRQVTLQTLDDNATVVLPLQHAPLVPSRRFGTIHFRHILVSKGEVAPREGEEFPDEGTIAAAFRDVDLNDLLATRDYIQAIRSALAEIQSIWIAKAGYEQSVTFPKLGALVERILEVLEDAVIRRDSGMALATTHVALSSNDAAASPPDASLSSASRESFGELQSATEASIALDKAAGYFAASEPSSLALLLVRQAQQLVGRSFFDVIQVLVPQHAEQAAVRVGLNLFEIPIERLAGASLKSEDDNDAIANIDDRLSFEKAPLPGNSAAVQQEPCSDHLPKDLSHKLSSFQPRTRFDAIALLEAVSAYYRVHEPASPVPLLVDRACADSRKDFISLLREVLPGLSSTPE
jgi:type VI secretion system protein ImpA